MNSLESQLFTWNEWCLADMACFSFLDIELVRDIGPFKKGTKFDGAYVDYENATLEFYNNGPTIDGVTPSVTVAVFDLLVDTRQRTES